MKLTPRTTVFIAGGHFIQDHSSITIIILYIRTMTTFVGIVAQYFEGRQKGMFTGRNTMVNSLPVLPSRILMMNQIKHERMSNFQSTKDYSTSTDQKLTISSNSSAEVISTTLTFTDLVKSSTKTIASYKLFDYNYGKPTPNLLQARSDTSREAMEDGGENTRPKGHIFRDTKPARLSATTLQLLGTQEKDKHQSPSQIKHERMSNFQSTKDYSTSTDQKLTISSNNSAGVISTTLTFTDLVKSSTKTIALYKLFDYNSSKPTPNLLQARSDTSREAMEDGGENTRPKGHIFRDAKPARLSATTLQLLAKPRKKNKHQSLSQASHLHQDNQSTASYGLSKSYPLEEELAAAFPELPIDTSHQRLVTITESELIREDMHTPIFYPNCLSSLTVQDKVSGRERQRGQDASAAHFLENSLSLVGRAPTQRRHRKFLTLGVAELRV
ncbi:uncharacterized protein G2W53_036949 [Senna tora]|uniref:Uncharacterized protein n=1 Tax=Senna tora TaxID=362788 RepID=A0A834SUV2_9FABA|nr:uncharacterized protein G2W53_036949 [Senna tora]